MFKERKNSFRRNMAILVCVAFISMVFPEVTQAATRSSSERFPFPKESISLISAVISFASLNLSPLGYDLAFFYSLSNNSPILPDESKIVKWDYYVKKKESFIKSNGNSTSKKPPEGKDDN